MSESNKAVLRSVLEAHANGDVSPMRSLLDPGFISTVHAPRELFRSGGQREGIANAIVTMSQVSTDFTIHGHQVQELVEEGDVIWVRGVLDVTSRETSKRVAFPIAGRWQFKDGRALSAEWYFDSVALASELGIDPK